MEKFLQTFIQINTIFDKLFEWLKDCYWLRCCNNYYNKQEENEKFKKEILEQVRQNRMPVYFLEPNHLERDKDFVLELVKANGLALEFIRGPMRRDAEVVLAAVRQNGLALKHASPEFKINKDLVLDAIKQNPCALKYSNIGYENDDDRLFHHEALKIQCEALKRKHEELEKISEQLKLPQEDNNNQVALYQELQISHKKCKDLYQKYQTAVYNHASKMLENNCNPISSMPFELRANEYLVRAILESKLDEETKNTSLKLCFIGLDCSGWDKSVFENIDAKIESSSLNEEKKNIWETFKNDFNKKYHLVDKKLSISPQCLSSSSRNEQCYM